MHFDLTDKRVLISAGGSGIGRAIVEGFVEQGAQVVTCDINPDFVADLKTVMPSVMAQVVDVSDETAVQNFSNAAIEHLGGLDCLGEQRRHCRAHVTHRRD
jgi:NAD(P)-dependent dehydrogenase (short-subunit alcohol dehydrogenase family)